MTLQRQTQSQFPEATWKGLVDGGMIIAGSPQTVRQRMEELIKTLHVGHVFCLLHTGNQPDDKTRHNTKLFAEEVMPHLRNLWPEWADDDRWWIHPLEDRVRPEATLVGAR
jgi:alkanesulfonate monooxygenase SsuD/methylene tetrahydromethanopterin reductase-like flavin-dependent oxidoreductase (luciferase family)